jgi:hypothetical protein
MARPDDQKLQQILDLLAEVKTDFNALRADFLRHDHGAGGTYATGVIRLNSSTNSLATGTNSSTTLANAYPATVADLYAK